MYKRYPERLADALIRSRPQKTIGVIYGKQSKDGHRNGCLQGIGAAVVKAFLERGYNVVGTSRSATKSAELKASDKLVLVDGDIGDTSTAQKVVETAVQKFSSVDVVVNNAGIFRLLRARPRCFGGHGSSYDERATGKRVFRANGRSCG